MLITEADLARLAELFKMYELYKRGGAFIAFPPLS